MSMSVPSMTFFPQPLILLSMCHHPKWFHPEGRDQRIILFRGSIARVVLLEIMRGSDTCLDDFLIKGTLVECIVHLIGLGRRLVGCDWGLVEMARPSREGCVTRLVDGMGYG
jgi:hypothetical protein